MPKAVMQKSTAETSTIKDVAQHAGVSYQTVSRVINDHPSVSPATRARVQAAIHKLDYHPSSAAQLLAAKRSGVIGVVTYGLMHFGPAKMLASLDDAARSLGYTVSNMNIGAFVPKEIGRAIQQLRRQKVEGIIVFAPTLEVSPSEIETLCGEVPLVITDTEPSPARYVTNMDHFTGTRVAAQHLLALGHRRIGFINGPQSWYASMIRRQGWLSALNQAGLEPSAEYEGDWNARSGHKATNEFLERDLGITAILAANDQMALGALHALHQRNLELPREMSVIGYDDIPEAEFFEPALTTVRHEFGQLAQKALEQLMSRIEGRDKTNELVVIVPNLIMRDSTGPARVETIVGSANHPGPTRASRARI
jgi:DNA-binding LacI/PurR family transcriptional regulator